MDFFSPLRSVVSAVTQSVASIEQTIDSAMGLDDAAGA
jgi:hypothetical protein